MLKFLDTFFKPPQVKNSESQEKAHLLHQLLLSFICLDLLIFAVSALVHPTEYLNRMTLFVLAFCVFSTLYIINRRGYPDFTAMLLCIMLFLLVVLAILLTYRSSFVSATGFLLVVFCAGLLVNRRFALMIAVATSMVSLALILLLNQSFGLDTRDKLYIWLIYIGLLFAGTILLNLVLGGLEAGQASLKERAFLLDQIADAVITTTMEGKILSWNEAAERLYGWTLEEVLARPLKDFVNSSYLQATMTSEKAYEQLLENGFWQGEVIHKHRNGTEIPFLASVTLIQDAENKPRGMVAVNRDNRTGKALEENRLYTKLLESDLKKEQDLSGFRDRVLSTLSHEFRTPLAVIQSSVDIFRRHGSKLTEEQTEERLNKIQRQVNRLLHLLNDVVELGRGNQQRPNEAEAIDLQAFCEELAEEYRLMYPAYLIRLDLGQLPSIFYAERRILEHILTNLLSNAIKYSPEGSEIIFSVYENETMLELSIEDKGIGIPSEDQAHIFETFHRAKNVGAIEGTGIGLAIVKQSVSNLGGTIELVSEEGKGSSFLVKLPIVPAPIPEKVLS